MVRNEHSKPKEQHKQRHEVENIPRISFFLSFFVFLKLGE